MTIAPTPTTHPGAGVRPYRVCFVCSGNICRSPIAEVVFTRQVRERGLQHLIVAESAGTGDWHVGKPADHRAVATLAAHGDDGSAHRARQFRPGWFDRLDLVIALDRGHERLLTEQARSDEERERVRLLLDFNPGTDDRDVHDPYYDGPEAFETAWAVIEPACAALADHLAEHLQPARA